jgi:hypothetical protein
VPWPAPAGPLQLCTTRQYAASLHQPPDDGCPPSLQLPATRAVILALLLDSTLASYSTSSANPGQAQQQLLRHACPLCLTARACQWESVTHAHLLNQPVTAWGYSFKSMLRPPIVGIPSRKGSHMAMPVSIGMVSNGVTTSAVAAALPYQVNRTSRTTPPSSTYDYRSIRCIP